MSEAAKTAIADAYRHAATSAIMSKDRGKFTTQMLGLGLEGMDVISKSVGVLKDGKTPFFEKFAKMGNIFGDSSMDAYNNKLGLKYSGSKSDVLSALNIAFEKQLNRMKNPNYKFRKVPGVGKVSENFLHDFIKTTGWVTIKADNPYR